jgi:hypothetical protein
LARHIQAWSRAHPAAAQALLAALALLAGALVYYFDRAPGSAYFLLGHSAREEGRGFFGALGGPLPEFLHTFAFILLSSAVLAPGPRGVALISLAWFCIELFFELGQHAAFAPLIAAWVPSWFLAVPLLDQTAHYFMNGEFDSVDVLAITAGALSGYLTSRTVSRMSRQPG